jgi:hypothetical protein
MSSFFSAAVKAMTDSFLHRGARDLGLHHGVTGISRFAL